MEGVKNIVATLPTITPNIETGLISKNIMLPTIPVLYHHRTKHLFKDVQVLIHLLP